MEELLYVLNKRGQVFTIWSSATSALSSSKKKTLIAPKKEAAIAEPLLRIGQVRPYIAEREPGRLPKVNQLQNERP
ncbi:MAG: hypothetical protein ABSC06_37425 [Rhodopila sp.]